LWDESRVLCCSLLRSASQTLPMLDRMAGAEVFTEVVVSRDAAFTPVRFMVDLADFMAAGFTADGTVASRASTMVSATATAANGTTAGVAGATAGGRVRGWEGLTIH